MTSLLTAVSFEQALRALLLLNLFDLVSTQFWVHSGLTSEANPVMAQAMDLSPLSFGAAKMGLDRNKWFGNVEVAAARTISREPVNYVRNIYKYYVTYRRLEDIRKSREAASRK